MSKVCTDIEQSKRLIELGIDINTADMMWFDDGIGDPFEMVGFNKTNDKDTPAWSLSALMKTLPSELEEKGKFGIFKYTVHFRKYKITEDVDVCQISYGNYGGSGYTWKDMINTGEREEMIDAVFEMIVWLLENKKI